MRWTLCLITFCFTIQTALAQVEDNHQGAERRWAARNAEIAASWHVVAFGEERIPCVPLATFIRNANTPNEALKVIQAQDPDAYLAKATHPGQWERIIRTSGHNLRMVQGQTYCRIWNDIMFGSGGGVTPDGVEPHY